MKPIAGLGKTDMWDFDLQEKGGELPCSNIRTLASYLCSPSTSRARLGKLTLTGTPRVSVLVVGPVADDGQELIVSHIVQQAEFGRLEEEDKRAFVSRLQSLMVPKVPSNKLYRVLGLPK